MDKREAVADALHAWSENSPDRDYFFGDGDTTVFSMMQDTCADGARIIREMAAELAALRSTGTGRSEAAKRTPAELEHELSAAYAQRDQARREAASLDFGYRKPLIAWPRSTAAPPSEETSAGRTALNPPAREGEGA